MQAYPLSWPAGWPRLPGHARTRARFSKGERQYSNVPGGGSWDRRRDLTVADGTHRVLTSLRMLGVLDGDAVISTNLQVRLDGLPRSGQAQPDDPGVAVYWERPGEGPKCMAIDLYDRVADNLAAVAATLEAMRAIERHGGAQILARAFTGFTALPAPGQSTARGWREVLGFPPGRTPPFGEIESNYRLLRSRHHPDKPGGDADRFNEVQIAYQQASAELG